jgi:hypothetical protein
VEPNTDTDKDTSEMTRVYELLLGSETVFAELLMGVISITFGVWLTTPAAEVRSNAAFVDSHMLETVGVLLCFAGLLKLVGVYRGRLGFRALSCLLAVVTWSPVAWCMLGGVSPAKMGSMLSMIMAVFNALVFVRLYVLRSQRKRNGGQANA